LARSSKPVSASSTKLEASAARYGDRGTLAGVDNDGCYGVRGSFHQCASVASATEEMSSSVNEISRQVQESARIANEAVDQARKTNDRVGELSKAASRIGDVVELINTIAGQTNSSCAQLPPSRRRAPARQVAVLRSWRPEVKALAEQTAKATGEIGQQNLGYPGRDPGLGQRHQGDRGTIEKLSEISSTIAAAVEEQGAATQEISRTCSRRRMAPAGLVEHHRRAARRQRDRIGFLAGLSAAQSLSGDSNRLKLEVGKFLSSVRAACNTELAIARKFTA